MVPATLAGALLALSRTDGRPDWRLIAVTLANNLVVAYAFMINDIEDAPDDARDPARAARNPVTCGEITPRQGWTASLAVAALTGLLYALCGERALWVGLLNLGTAHLYSWKPVRLKALPALDVISHALMLSALLVLAGYVTYDATPGPVWLAIGAAFLASAYGQLYNQLRDYDMDEAAGLHNTAVTVGARGTRWLMYGALGLAVVGGLVSLVAFFPPWLIGVIVVSFPIVMLVLRPKTDMRGGEAVDVSGTIQIQTLAWMNLITLIWLGAAILL